MNLKKRSISLLFVAIFIIIAMNPAKAQKWKQKRLEKLYNRGKLEKCEKKARKYSSKKKLKEFAYYYRTLVTLEFYKKSINNYDSSRNIRKSMALLERSGIIGLKEKFPMRYQEIYEQVHEIISFEARKNFALSKKREAKYFYDKLAEFFHDTTSQYLVFHAPKEVTPDLGEEERIDSVSIKRIKLIETAKGLVGIEYKYGGEDPKGFDCSGFVKYLYLQVDTVLPHNANMQSKLGAEVSLQETLPGDLIFFGNSNKNGGFRAYHAAMILKNDNGEIDLVHCVNRGVSIDETGNSTNKYWLKKNYVVRRILK